MSHDLLKLICLLDFVPYFTTHEKHIFALDMAVIVANLCCFWYVLMKMSLYIYTQCQHINFPLRVSVQSVMSSVLSHENI